MTHAMLFPVRLSGEPDRWYARFCDFCLMGSSRTLEGLWRSAAASKGKKRHLPGSWSRACDRWNWRKRAAEFDEARQEEQLRELEEARREERENRRARVVKLGSQVDKLLNGDGTSPARATLLRVYFEASRAEFGSTNCDLPESRTEPVSSEEFERIMALFKDQ